LIDVLKHQASQRQLKLRNVNKLLDWLMEDRRPIREGRAVEPGARLVNGAGVGVDGDERRRGVTSEKLFGVATSTAADFQHAEPVTSAGEFQDFLFSLPEEVGLGVQSPAFRVGAAGDGLTMVRRHGSLDEANERICVRWRYFNRGERD
jgi:hypothetical protein